MAAELIIVTDKPPITWDEFVHTHPLGSIALDGYVIGRPRFDAEGPYLNANHHEEVDRLATLSTAEQILRNFRMGMARAFVDKVGQFSPKVFANDCDQDICAAWFLLSNPAFAERPTPELNRFIAMAGTLDTTAGMFPYPSSGMTRQLAWIFRPYTTFRASGKMAERDSAEYRRVIDGVCGRIGLHLDGQGKEVELDTRYKIVGGGENWSMIQELGQDGKLGAFQDGIDAYVIVQPLEEGRYRYSVGRRSEFIPFPLAEILEALNEAESCGEDKWGGSTIIGGSPRIGNSRLSPERVQSIINSVLDKRLKTVFMLLLTL